MVVSTLAAAERSTALQRTMGICFGSTLYAGTPDDQPELLRLIRTTHFKSCRLLPYSLVRYMSA